MDACRRDGGWKGVKPGTRSSRSSSKSVTLGAFPSLGLPGIGGVAAGVSDRSVETLPGLRNPTCDCSLLSIFDFSLSFSFGALLLSLASFPLPLSALAIILANSSSTGGGDLALDFVALRMLCSNEERNRLNDLGEGSGTSGVNVRDPEA